MESGYQLPSEFACGRCRPLPFGAPWWQHSTPKLPRLPRSSVTFLLFDSLPFTVAAWFTLPFILTGILLAIRGLVAWLRGRKVGTFTDLWRS